MNPKLSLIDTHCDTAYELFHRGEHLDRNSCHIDLEKASCYQHYAQYFAVWSNKRLDDEACWQDFLKITDYFQAELDRLSDRAVQVRTGAELDAAWAAGKTAAILAVEDARLTAGHIERLDVLKRKGVRYMTLMWSGETCVGGSHNTQSGLTDFGKQLVAGCFERGIIPDVSHASEQSVDDLIPLARQYGKPFIASHSNSHEVCGHTRNLRDRHFAVIRELGGIIGINLCPAFLTDTNARPATMDDILAHIDHFMELGGEDVVGLGCDLDGTDLPEGFSHVGDLLKIADALAQRNYTEELIEKIFWKNYRCFALRNL